MEIETQIANIQAKVMSGDLHKSKGAEKIAQLRRQLSAKLLIQQQEIYQAGGIVTDAVDKARGLQSTRDGKLVRI